MFWFLFFRTGNHLCHITFFLTYFSLMKSFVWFVYLTYEWYVLLWKSGTQKDVTKKRSWFRMFPWCIPSVQTVVVAAMHEVCPNNFIFCVCSIILCIKYRLFYVCFIRLMVIPWVAYALLVILIWLWGSCFYLFQMFLLQWLE